MKVFCSVRLTHFILNIVQAEGKARIVLSNLYQISCKRTCRMLKNWQRNLGCEMENTNRHLEGIDEIDGELKAGWERVMTWAGQEWDVIAQGGVVEAEDPDTYEEMENMVYTQQYDINGDEK